MSQNVFSYYRMCSLYICRLLPDFSAYIYVTECVLLVQNVFSLHLPIAPGLQRLYLCLYFASVLNKVCVCVCVRARLYTLARVSRKVCVCVCVCVLVYLSKGFKEGGLHVLVVPRVEHDLHVAGLDLVLHSPCLRVYVCICFY